MSHNNDFNEIAGEVFLLCTSHEGNWWTDDALLEVHPQLGVSLLRCSAHMDMSFMRMCPCTGLFALALVEENVG